MSNEVIMKDGEAEKAQHLDKTQETRHIALTVGAQFAQSIASEIFKQTIVANAAGVAAILAYLANREVDSPFLLV